jgi:phosphoglycerate dehydrogenase-like enzyme
VRALHARGADAPTQALTPQAPPRPSPPRQGANAAGRDALAELFPALPALRWVHSASAGVNHLLFPALASAAHITLTNARGVYSASLAEWALFAAAYFAKDLPRLRAQQADARWEPYDVRPPFCAMPIRTRNTRTSVTSRCPRTPIRTQVEELRGRTLGVVGFGDIGRAAARLARAYGMRVLALRRTAPARPDPDAPCDEVFPPERLHDLMAASDYVVMATPLTPETTKLVDRAAIGAMRRRGVFINLGRGPCVEEQALIEALQAGAIRGAALDVFEVEPLPRSSPLWALPNALLSPHCADRTADFQADAMRAFAANAARYVAGQALESVVDKAAGY